MLVHGLEPAGSAALSGGAPGAFAMQGWAGFVVPLWDRDKVDSVDAIGDDEALEMTLRLAREEGVFAGISTGANVVGAIEIQRRLGGDAAVVTVLPDTNKKYLSTDLLREEPVREDYLAPYVEITGFTALPRVCSGCIDF